MVVIPAVLVADTVEFIDGEGDWEGLLVACEGVLDAHIEGVCQ